MDQDSFSSVHGHIRSLQLRTEKLTLEAYTKMNQRKMTQPAPLRFFEINNHADSRGDSYYLPREALDFVGAVDEIHCATIFPGATRGNHYHTGRREFIFLVYSDNWCLASAYVESKQITTDHFDGQGAVVIQIEPGIAHAIKNTGNTSIRLVSFSNKRFDPENPDTFHRELLS